MLSAFKYRIYPKYEQEMRLNRSLLSLCNLYNNLKAEEMRRYREEHRSTSQTKFRALALDARRHDDELQRPTARSCRTWATASIARSGTSSRGGRGSRDGRSLTDTTR